MNEDGADSGKGTEGASGQHANRPDSEMRGNEREEEVGERKQKTGKPRAWGGAGPLVPMYLDGVELAQASAILARHSIGARIRQGSHRSGIRDQFFSSEG